MAIVSAKQTVCGVYDDLNQPSHSEVTALAFATASYESERRPTAVSGMKIGRNASVVLPLRQYSSKQVCNDDYTSMQLHLCGQWASLKRDVAMTAGAIIFRGVIVSPLLRHTPSHNLLISNRGTKDLKPSPSNAAVSERRHGCGIVHIATKCSTAYHPNDGGETRSAPKRRVATRRSLTGGLTRPPK
ncbi:hypothetical protein EVAR_98911_1 [Eumeta japonica]|uniref:Uncharacterized protein n=1 Tax=Eumeta variegata TaxID=151549 RepID=A0A4C1Y3F6_EUMVA|nr:hypothetical protein EVAR_98911_1 [Eumeta japonica]